MSNTPVLSAGSDRHYFACRLRHALSLFAFPANAKTYPRDHRRQAELLKNLINARNELLTYDLRIISEPDSQVYSRGRVTVVRKPPLPKLE